MDVLKLQREGFTIAEIADELGSHPATISRWIKRGGPPPAREADRSELVIDDFWSDRIKALLEANPRLLATSVFAIISAEGFEGSYPTVSRHVRALRGPRFSAGQQGLGADRDRTGRGVSVRLDRLLRLRRALRLGRAPLLRRDPLPVALAQVVVRPRLVRSSFRQRRSRGDREGPDRPGPAFQLRAALPALTRDDPRSQGTGRVVRPTPQGRGE
jgi:predicted transcriptional regulator